MKQLCEEKKMSDEEKTKNESPVTGSKQNEKLSRREAMKRMAKGITLIGTIGIATVTAQAGCRGSIYYNYVNEYFNYFNAYANSSTYDDYLNR
jgi:hypothetical protein